MLNQKYIPPALLYILVVKLSNLLDKLKSKLLPPSAFVLKMVVEDFILPRCIFIISELEIADKLHSGAKHINNLAEETKTDPTALFRIMRTLASRGIFKEVSSKTYSNTRISKSLKKNSPDSILDWLKYFASDYHQKQWNGLMASVRNGKDASQNLLGMRFFDWANENLEYQDQFANAMTNLSNLTNSILISAYNFKQEKTIIDIGGGNGNFLFSILKMKPTLQGTLFEIPIVIKRAQEELESLQQNLRNRIEFISGDFFKEIPTGIDIYMMKSVIHDWEDEQAIEILHNCSKSMTDKSKLLLFETIIEDNHAPQMSKFLDIAMLVLNGGKERTRNEFSLLLQKAGLKLIRVIPTTSPFKIIEATKDTSVVYR